MFFVAHGGTNDPFRGHLLKRSLIPLLALDEDLDALVARYGVMEPLEMVILHEKIWHPHKW